MPKYDGLTFDDLAKHCDEGWALANKRTIQLREAIEALRGCQGAGLKGAKLEAAERVLEWGNRMFPLPGESLFEVAAEDKEMSC